MNIFKKIKYWLNYPHRILDYLYEFNGVKFYKTKDHIWLEGHGSEFGFVGKGILYTNNWSKYKDYKIIGYKTPEGSENKGIMSKALGEFIKLNESKNLVASCRNNNPGSLKVLEKHNFKKVEEYTSKFTNQTYFVFVLEN